MPPRPPPTHFLCLPLVTGASRQQLSASLGSFGADITSPHSYGVPPEAIRPLGTLHLTLGVMSFPKGDGLDKAVEVLKALTPKQILADVRKELATEMPSAESEAVLEPLGLSLTLKGLSSMQQASKASVLYAPPNDEEGVLQRFCEEIRRAFKDAGLMEEENRPLLLHATIVNTIYVKGGRGKASGQGHRREKLAIDARGIIDRYDDFIWMQDVPVEKIAICRMGAKKQEDGDEAYEVEAEVDLVEHGAVIEA